MATDEEMDVMAQEAQDLAEYLNEKADDFDRLCQQRHEAGEKEYGSITFLGNDVIRMMLEELADTANYCKMQGIKLLMLQEQLEQDPRLREFQSEEGEEDLQIGFDSFKGVKDIGWGKS